MKTKVIFFDLDHTLIDTRQQYLSGLELTLQLLYGTDVPSDFIPRFMQHNDELWPQYDKRILNMKGLRRQRFLMTWKDYGVTRTNEEADEFQDQYNQTFESTLKCFPGTIQMLGNLTQEYGLGIITNGAPDLQERKLTITGLRSFFPEKSVIVSEAIGLAKPDPLVYEAACRQFAVGSEECLMVGDNYKNDVLGARACGLDALWYGPDPVTTKELKDIVAQRMDETPLRTPEEVLAYISARR